ncbi:MAG: ORF6C domain-containing protein [Chloroflexi bacterium]|nr:ORF6C domain-containing protein [Chloroflexota bacterium]
MEVGQEQLAIMQRLDNAAIVIGDVRKRVTALEQQLAPRNAITDEQSADVANKVQALAMYLTEQDKGKNHFQAIYAELHRRFRVSSYKTIRQEQYQVVVDFLDRWANAAAKG